MNVPESARLSSASLPPCESTSPFPCVKDRTLLPLPWCPTPTPPPAISGQLPSQPCDFNLSPHSPCTTEWQDATRLRTFTISLYYPRFLWVRNSGPMGQEAKRNYHSSAAQKGVRKGVAGWYWLIAILKSSGAQAAPDDGLPSTVLALLSESPFPSQRGGPTCDTMLCSQCTSCLQRFSNQKAALHPYCLWPLQAESTVVLPIRWSLEKRERERERETGEEKKVCGSPVHLWTVHSILRQRPQPQISSSPSAGTAEGQLSKCAQNPYCWTRILWGNTLDLAEVPKDFKVTSSASLVDHVLLQMSHIWSSPESISSF